MCGKEGHAVGELQLAVTAWNSLPPQVTEVSNKTFFFFFYQKTAKEHLTAQRGL
jgi:hypothetical protein